MTALVLIQQQLKKQQKIGSFPYLRWKLEQEKVNASPKTLGEAFRSPQTQR
jgi:hypothetical protein